MSAVVSLVGLVVIVVAIGAIAIVAMLLANPQTRGVGLTFLATGGLLFLLGAVFLTAAQVRVERKFVEVQAAEMRDQAADRAAWDVEGEPGPDQTWEDIPHEASARAHGHGHAGHGHAPSHDGHAHEAATDEAAAYGRELSTAEAIVAESAGASPTWFMGSVWLLVFGTVLVGLLLVRSESSMGVGLLGLAGGAVVLMLVLGAWVYVAVDEPTVMDNPRVASNQTTSSTEYASSEVESAWDYATAPRIVLDDTESENNTGDDNNTEVEIILDSEKLAKLGITSLEVIEALKQQDSQGDDRTIGELEENGQSKLQVEVNSLNPKHDLSKFKEVIVRNEGDGEEVRLGDVARIELVTRENSVQPSKPSRPEWTDETYTVINHDKNSHTTRRVVVSQPYSTIEECDEDLIGAVDRAVEQHLADLTGSYSYVTEAHKAVSRAFIMQNCVIERFAEQKQSDTGFPYWRQWVQLEFTPATDQQLLASYRSAKRADRITQVAMGGAGVLGTLGLILGMLRIDTATKGYYSKRLFIGVPVAIIAALGLLAFLA